MEWADGGAERDTAAMWQDIDEIIERNMGAGEPALDRTETLSDGAATSIDEAETSADEADTNTDEADANADDAEALVVDADSGATPETSAAPDGVDAEDPLAAVNSKPESLIIEEADFLAPPAEVDAEPGEPGHPTPEDGATDGQAPPPDAPPTEEDDMMEGAGETPSGDAPSADAEQAEEAADEGTAAPRTSDPTEGRLAPKSRRRIWPRIKT